VLTEDQLSDLVQDRFIHFDNDDYDGSSVWNIYDFRKSQARGHRKSVTHGPNPFASYGSRMAALGRSKRSSDAAVIWLNTWADLARCLALCIESSVAAVQARIEFVVFDFSDPSARSFR